MDYAAEFGPDRLLVLPREYQRVYDTCIPNFDDTQSKGSGPARNFIWDHASDAGAARHWVMDDNIDGFFRFHRNQKFHVGDGMIFTAMEDFVDRYRNIALAGPQYEHFAPARSKLKPFTLNTRVFSCILVRTDLRLRWRARYNEDLDLSIRSLRAGWCNVVFNAFLQGKIPTQQMAGGNTEAFYAVEGTRPKSELIVHLHPDVCRLVERYGRVHHEADFSQWAGRHLIRRDDAVIPETDPYPMRLVTASKRSRQK